MAIGTYMSIITLNVNGLNAPTKRQRLAEWLQKQDPYICCLKKSTADLKTHIDWKWEDGKIYSMQMGSKKSWSSNPHIRQLDLKVKKITKDKEGHSIMIKGSIQKEDIPIVNIYAPNRGAPQSIRQTLIRHKRRNQQ